MAIKQIEQLTEEELLKTYSIACQWTVKRFQVSGTNKNELGEIYDHDLCMLAIRKIERLENEMRRREVIF